MRIAEALLWLILARCLIGAVRFGTWRHWLGQLANGPRSAQPTAVDRSLAAAVEAAVRRLPFTATCLARAMALHWMLRRRHRYSQLVIGVRPGAMRGGVDDLHAWVEIGGTTLIGELDEPFLPLARFETGT